MPINTIEPEDMTHEVTLNMDFGSITFQVAANYFGPGKPEEGIEGWLKQLYPAAVSVSVFHLEN